MHFILKLLIDAGLLFILASVLPGVSIKNYGNAIFIILVLGLLNATVGFVLRLPLNILTLGLLSFFVKVFVSGILIKFASNLFKGFKVRTWTTAFILAFAIAVLSTGLDFIF
ncbi:MAG: phage holin family protein [Ginsengibacter sp.]